jgi:carboxyl-terminal processing protease
VLGDRYGEGDHWNYMYDQDKKIAYIRLTHFSRHTADELKVALQEMVKQGMRGLILDLRFNPGGLLSQATEISDMFIEQGLIVSTKGRNSPERSWHAKKDGTFSGFPMAILINRYSASASEIVSACLKDHDRAIVVGERSWGKGSVQNVIDLEGGASGQSALKLTTASYHRPNGKNIHRFEGAKDEDEWGVLPSEGHRMRFTDEQMQSYLEYRQKRDILGGETTETFEDTQLEDAVKYIVGKLDGKGDAAQGKKGETAEKKAAKAPAPPKPREGALRTRRIRLAPPTSA